MARKSTESLWFQQRACCPEKIKKTTDDHENLCENDEKDKALVTKEMTLSNIGNDILIGDSDATSHTTNNKTEVYELTLVEFGAYNL